MPEKSAPRNEQHSNESQNNGSSVSVHTGLWGLLAALATH